MQNAPLVMSFFTSFLLAYVGTAMAFQTSNIVMHLLKDVKEFGIKALRNKTQLPAKNDGGMDAFTAQLQAAHAEASTISQSSGSTILADAYATEMMDSSRSVVTAAATAAEKRTANQAAAEEGGKHKKAAIITFRYGRVG